jgi:hypothetical protein
MSSRLIARRDLAFLLHEWLDVASLCVRPPFDLRASLDDTTLGMRDEWF